ncbi:MAG: serine hydrolase, partial [Bacteroidota bacterium]
STIQNIASISKTLIGIALLKAQEQGKLKLNDPINQYLPFKITNPHYPDIPILIKHLAHHSSSIIDLDEVYSRSYILKKSVHDDNEGVYDWFNQPESKISMIDFIKNSLTIDGKWYEKATFAQTKPGETTAYSNLGATLCAQIIELATGQDYRSFTQEHILQPLKMTASGWSENDIDTTKRSRLFANKEMLIAEYDLITYPDGGFITSNQDLGLFLTELIKGYKGQGTLLNKERYEKLFERPQLPNPAEGEAFGIFITFSNQFLKMKELVIGHDGSDPGAMTAMYFDPKTEMGKILLINTDSDFDDQFWPEVVSIWKALLKYESAYNKRKASGTN